MAAVSRSRIYREFRYPWRGPRVEACRFVKHAWDVARRLDTIVAPLLVGVTLAVSQAVYGADAPAAAAPPIDAPAASSVPGEIIPQRVPLDLERMSLTEAVLPDFALPAPSLIRAAPASELAEGLGVQITHNRRKFRNRAVNWVQDQSPTAGFVADLLLRGAKSGWHVEIDPTGTREYLLEWNVKF